jgi:hypothetical protein
VIRSMGIDLIGGIEFRSAAVMERLTDRSDIYAPERGWVLEDFSALWTFRTASSV